MNNDSRPDALSRCKQQLAETIAEALRAALTSRSAAGSATPWTSFASVGTAAGSSIDSSLPTVAFSLAGSLAGSLYLSFDPASSGSLLASAEGTPPEDPAQAWLALAKSYTSSLEQALTSLFGSTTPESCDLVSPEGHLVALAEITLEQGSGERANVKLSMDASLQASLTTLASASSLPTPSAGTCPDDAHAQIERVIDVPLAVSLRFGQRHLTLREVLALSTGSLIELDRQVEEPVDLVLGDRLIARGEVVIVDGNYGLRVTEVMEGAAHRIQRLHASASAAAAAEVQAA